MVDLGWDESGRQAVVITEEGVFVYAYRKSAEQSENEYFDIVIDAWENEPELFQRYFGTAKAPGVRPLSRSTRPVE
ncbi:MAG: hypothetical protein ACOX8W_07550 [bacterium]